jgi:pyruvate ferredoxin oxidoreductase gamma subunit/2-oxoisovalerate ferredoxin oxidoreductase gamma subunit
MIIFYVSGANIMIEIRFHGRGGQGAVTAANILAEAAFREGNDVQAFPYFGVERRGAPVTAFTKIDKKPIRVKSQIYEPDYVVVLAAQLVESINVAEGLKPNGCVIINTNKPPKAFKDLVEGRVVSVDATEIAIKNKLGTRTAPIVNTAILGGLAKASGIVKIESIIDSIKDRSPAKKEENAKAAQDAYENTNLGE